MAKLKSLDDLLVHELQDIYHAEGQILKALPKMIKAASHPELQAAFEEHLAQTEGQVERLEQAFKLLGVPAKAKKCDGMAGLIEEGKKMMEEDAAPSVMDAALIAAAQKVEHYEIASYGLRLHLRRDAGVRPGPRSSGPESGRGGDHRRAAHRAGRERDQRRGRGSRRYRGGRRSFEIADSLQTCGSAPGREGDQ